MPAKNDDLNRVTAETALDHHGIPVIYSFDGYNTKVDAVVDFDVEVVGFDNIPQKITTVTISSALKTQIGGEFYIYNKNYVIDNVVSDDGQLKTLSVIKQV